MFLPALSYCHHSNRVVTTFSTTTTGIPSLQHNHFRNKSTTRSDFSKSTSTIKWPEVKAKASAEKVVAQRIRVLRVRNPTAQRLACRSVCHIFLVTFAFRCDPRSEIFDLTTLASIVQRMAAARRVLLTSGCAGAELSRVEHSRESNSPRVRFEALPQTRQQSLCRIAQFNSGS
jgi:hypothetical protein